MAVNFPSNPTNGQTITVSGITYAYDSTQGVWSDNPQGLTQAIDALTDVDTSTSAPSNGQVLQWNSTDSEWQPADAGAGVTVYATIDDLPLTGVTEGSMALVDSTDKLYIFSDAGWYSITLVNTTPSISGVSATYTLATDGTATTVTVTATDAEGIPLTYSIVSDTSGNIATVTQGTGSNTNQWTITPSTNTANQGDFTLVFRASDGVNVASASSTFTLLFAYENSKYTTALITSVGANNAVNNSFDDASTNNHTITANGNVTQNTFSPYRHGGYSTYFDGNGDYLGTPNITMLAADQTVEFWAWHEGTGDGDGVLGSVSDNSFLLGLKARTPWIWVNSQTLTNISGYTISNGHTATGNTAVSDGWHHYAYDIDVGASITTLTTYVDGSTYGSLSWSNTSLTSRGIGRGLSSGFERYFIGYIADLRVVSSRLYTGTFTPPTERLTAVTNTSLLACHLPYIVDGSTNSHSITVNGNTKTEPFSPYNHSGYSTGSYGGSMYLTGTNAAAEHLYVNDASGAVALGGGDSTFEMWIYPTSTKQCALFDYRDDNNSPSTAPMVWLDASNQPYLYLAGAQRILHGNACIANQWHHIALVRSSGVWSLYLNGVAASTTYTYSTTVTTHAYRPIIGRSGYHTTSNSASNQYHFPGHITDVRAVVGTAVYTSNFTPPTAPLTAITNTSLLLNGTNAGIIDKSQSVKTITLNGDVKSSTTQSKYLTSSIYFDGAGDYLTIPSIQFGTAPFTIEMWVRLSVVTTSSNIPFLSSGTSSSTGTFQFEISSNSKLGFQYDSASTFTTSSGLTADTWHHVAISRAGTGTNETKLFLDGVLAGTSTVASDFNSTADMFIGRNRGNSTYASGYISDVRITKGLARYTSNFTVPSAALGG